MKDYSGVLSELVDGTWEEPGTGKRYDIGIRSMVIRDTLEGEEASLVAALHHGKKITVISDPFTHDAMGQRIFKALKADNQQVNEYVWKTPQCSDKGVEQIQNATPDCDVRIAVGSGTVSDTVKYASFLDDKRYSVFATSPMNAYSTGTASVSFGGFKKSITCRGAEGVFFDLSVLAKCPPKLISAAFADVICRTTAQVDWLLSHLLFDTPYAETPYTLLAYDETDMINNASRMLSGDVDALGMLTRISAIMGLGTRFTETTHSGSMAEHQISHFIDMFAGADHPGSSHGEQVGVGTITMSALQNQVLQSDTPPLVLPTEIPAEQLQKQFGIETAKNMIAETKRKALDAKAAEALNHKLQEDWPAIAEKLNAVMIPFDQLQQSMRNAGCALTATDLGLNTDFYRDAVTYARFIRDRFSMLDLVDDSTGLESFVSQMQV
jgi:glycerol-1-phosphate dehydrogenase [NAD(P)+]